MSYQYIFENPTLTRLYNVFMEVYGSDIASHYTGKRQEQDLKYPRYSIAASSEHN